MELGALLAQCDPPAETVAEADHLLELKLVTRELGKGAVPPHIGHFIVQELDLVHDTYEGAEATVSEDARRRANEFFLTALTEFGGTTATVVSLKSL